MFYIYWGNPVLFPWRLIENFIFLGFVILGIDLFHVRMNLNFDFFVNMKLFWISRDAWIILHDSVIRKGIGEPFYCIVVIFIAMWLIFLCYYLLYIFCIAIFSFSCKYNIFKVLGFVVGHSKFWQNNNYFIIPQYDSFQKVIKRPPYGDQQTGCRHVLLKKGYLVYTNLIANSRILLN